MKRYIMVLSALCPGLFFNMAIAQENGANVQKMEGTSIKEVRQASPSVGKLITMDQAVYTKDLNAQNLEYFWNIGENHSLITKKGGKYFNIDVEGKRDDEEKTIEKPQLANKVRGSKNITASPFIENMKPIHAFTVKNNLFVCDAEGRVDTVTSYDKNSQIVAGDIVSRNEFGVSKGIFWAPDAKKLAFYVKDESRVTDFPIFDITTRTGTNRNLKYPMAGMDSELLKLGIYDIESRATRFIDHVSIAKNVGWARPEETYITNVCWSPDGQSIYTQLLDRGQKHSLLCRFDKEGKHLATILSEDNAKYVEPLDPLYFISGQNELFIYRTANRDGYRSLYLCNNEGIISRITKVQADVEYLGNDGKFVYYTSAEVCPVDNHLFRIEMKGLRNVIGNSPAQAASKVKFGKPERLTKESGWHNISLSPDCKYFVDNFSSLNVPRVINLCKADGTIIKNMLTAKDPTQGYAFCEMTLGTVKSADGKYDNWYRLIKPKDFDPSKKYPLIVYVYGGPHSQLVKNTFLGELRRWEMYMAQRGYIVYVQDNRGTMNRGLEFEQAIHGQCGQAEMADQMEGVKMLMKLPYIDKDRIGVHGWSYGGFMTISLITNFPDIFKVAVAGGPVIDWKWYEVMYGERYMDSPDNNAEGYDKVSLINKAKDLKGKLLICQGVIDPVVVWQHSLNFVRECVKNNIQVDYFPYPRAEHNVIGKDRIHLMDKVSMYFNDYL